MGSSPSTKRRTSFTVPKLKKEKDPEKKKIIMFNYRAHQDDGCDVRDFFAHAFEEAKKCRFGLVNEEDVEDAELALESKYFLKFSDFVFFNRLNDLFSQVF